MAHTRAWSTAYEAIPAGSDAIREGDDRIRELKSDVRERMTVEHAWKEDQTFDGMHAFAQNLAKTTATLTEIETFIGAAGGNTITLDPTLLAGKPFFVMKNDASANPVTISLDSGNWNDIAVADHTFYPGSSADIVLANRGDYIWGVCDGTDFWIFGIRRNGLRILTAAGTIDEFDDIVLCDGTSAVVPVTLPAANLVEGKVFIIKATNVDNAVTIVGTVDGVASPTIDVVEETWIIGSNGTDYERLNKWQIQTADLADNLVTLDKLEDRVIHIFNDATAKPITSGAFTTTGQSFFYKTASMDALDIKWKMKIVGGGTGSAQVVVEDASSATATSITVVTLSTSYIIKDVALDISALDDGWCELRFQAKQDAASTVTVSSVGIVGRP